MINRVTIYTDGACSGNPGPGGWGAILSCGKYQKELCGGELKTTNNRMELTAVIEALYALKVPCTVTLVTDSKYVVDGVSKGWAEKWRSQGWMRTKTDPALNADLWEKLLNALSVHNVTFQWVKGHAGHPQNERCDELAVSWYQRLQNKK